MVTAHRTRKAAITAGMTYLNLMLSVVIGIVLVPYVINKIGLNNYGLWAVVLELVGYLALTELGIFGVIPLRLAQADGASDRDAARRLIANALAFAVAAGLLVAVATAAFGAEVLGWLPGVTAEQAVMGRGPLLLLFGVTAVAVPLKVFAAVLAGLQDAYVGGLLRVGQSFLTLGLTVSLLEANAGLYALAVGAAVPSLLTGLFAAGRAWQLAPHLFAELPRPHVGGLGRLARDGFGYWIGGFGYGLMTASNGMFILLATGEPGLVATYVCLAKLPMLMNNLSRIPVESSWVGFAQLYAAGDLVRTAVVATKLMRVQSAMTGGTVALALALNPAFASRWYPVPYAGDAAHVSVASTAVILSVLLVVTGQVNTVHKFLLMGSATLANGLAYSALAPVAVAAIGLPGLALTLWGTTAVNTFSIGLFWHNRLFHLVWADWLAVVMSAARFLPVWLLAGWSGIEFRAAPVWQVGAMTVVIVTAVAIAARPVLLDLPLPAFIRLLLTTARLLPASGHTNVGAG